MKKIKFNISIAGSKRTKKVEGWSALIPPINLFVVFHHDREHYWTMSEYKTGRLIYKDLETRQEGIDRIVELVKSNPESWDRFKIALRSVKKQKFGIVN